MDTDPGGHGIDRDAAREALRVIHVLPDLAVAGGPRYIYGLVTAARGTAVEHHVAALDGGPMLDQFVEAGVPTFVLAGRTATRLPASARRLAAIVRERDIAIVHTNGTPTDRLVGQSAAALTRRRVVNTFHGVPLADLPREGPTATLSARAKTAARRAANIALVRTNIAAKIAVSDLVRCAQARALRLPAASFTVIPPGLPAAALRPADGGERFDVRAELGLGCVPVLVNVGRFDPAKGQELAVEVTAELARRGVDTRLVLVGDGVTRPDVEALAARLGVSDRVRFTGTRNDVPRLIQVGDLYLSTSTNEGFGIAPLEAMAKGIPVVAVAGENNAVEEFVTDGCSGVLVRSTDPATLADEVEALLGAPPRLAQMGRAAAEAARNRSAERSVAAVEQVYLDVMRAVR